jgi:hypothetical protein
VTAAGEPAAVAPAAPRPGCRRLLREERQLAVLWGVLAGCSLLLRPLWLAVAPLLPPCPFRALTGLPCLSCGTTRAAVAVLHGRPLEALVVNPLAALAGIAFIAGGAFAPLWAFLDLPVPHLASPPMRALRISLVALLLAGWAWVILADK